jgi:hypothetical protein
VRLKVNPLGNHYRPYGGPLPFGLDRGDSRATVNAKLGRPDTSLETSDHYRSRSPQVHVTYYPATSPLAGSIRELLINR